MPQTQDHIVKSFDDSLEQLRQNVVRMGGLAEAQLARAIQALSRRDAALAAEVVKGDAEIDRLEQEIGAQAIRVLALRQPMANDLREVVSSLKVSSDIERIGDYAANVAKRSIALAQLPAVKPAYAIPRLARLVQDIIKDTLDAYVNRDAARALDVWKRDEEVDEMYSGLFRELLTYMMEDPRNIGPCTHLMFIAKNVERIGDHATNIAETIHYQVTGRPMAGGRPKGDASSFEVVTPRSEE
jgi:phosphate transport system protein